MLVRDNGSASRGKDAAGETAFGEYQINIFQFKSLRFWIEEEDNRDPEEVKYCENDKDAPIDVLWVFMVSDDALPHSN